MLTDYELQEQRCERVLAHFDHLRRQGFPIDLAISHCAQRFGWRGQALWALVNDRRLTRLGGSGETLWGVSSTPDRFTPA